MAKPNLKNYNCRKWCPTCWYYKRWLFSKSFYNIFYLQNLSGLLKIVKWDSLDDPRVIGCRCLAYTIKCGFKFSIFTHLYEEIYILNYKGRTSLLSKKWPVLSVHNNVVVQQLTWDLHPIKNSYVYIILLFSIKADIVVWYQYSTVEKSTSKYLTSTLLKSALNIK